jgi:hypothetical protein
VNSVLSSAVAASEMAGAIVQTAQTAAMTPSRRLAKRGRRSRV